MSEKHCGKCNRLVVSLKEQFGVCQYHRVGLEMVPKLDGDGGWLGYEILKCVVCLEGEK